MERGTVVRATAGRDSDGLFVVAGAQDDGILIVNGKRRPIERPKRKNPKHLLEVGIVLSEDEIRSNRSIRRELREIKEEIPCRNRTI